MILPFFVLQGDNLHLRNSKIIDQSWPNSNQPSKDFPVGGNIRSLFLGTCIYFIVQNIFH